MTHHEADLYTARLIYAALTLLFTAALAYASGMLIWTGAHLILTINSITVVLF